MSPTTVAGMIGAGAAVFGALAGGASAFAVEVLRSRESSREAHRQELRSACSNFTAMSHLTNPGMGYGMRLRPSGT